MVGHAGLRKKNVKIFDFFANFALKLMSIQFRVIGATKKSCSDRLQCKIILKDASLVQPLKINKWVLSLHTIQLVFLLSVSSKLSRSHLMLCSYQVSQRWLVFSPPGFSQPILPLAGLFPARSFPRPLFPPPIFIKQINQLMAINWAKQFFKGWNR